MTPMYVRIRGRIQGPFELEKLRWLVRSGRLARFHEVSENKQNWRQASEISELFESTVGAAVEPTSGSSSSNNQPGTPSTSVTTTGSSDAQVSSQLVWHYALGTTTHGPVDIATIKDLARTGTLGTDDKVWREGMSDWQVWRTVPELAALSRSKLSVAGGARNSFLQQYGKPLAMTAILAVLVVGAGSMMLSGSKPATRTSSMNEGSQPDAKGQSKEESKSEENSQPTKKSRPPADSNFITSIRQHDDIRSAVGIVVEGWEVLFADGRQVQLARATGSGFAVSKDGFMLTNKHVIESFDKLSRADDEHVKTAYLQSALAYRSIEKRIKQTIEKEATQPLTIEELNTAAIYLRSLRKAVQRATPKLWVIVMAEPYEARIVKIHVRDDLAILKIERQFPKTFRVHAALPKRLLDLEVRAIGFPGSARVIFSDEEKSKKLHSILARPEKSFVDLLLKYESGIPTDNVKTSYESRDFDYVITQGRVNQVTADSATKLNWLQHSAALSGGYSGGPLVSKDAVVVGVNTQGAPPLERSFCLAQPEVRGFIDKNISGKVAWVNTLPEP